MGRVDGIPVHWVIVIVLVSIILALIIVLVPLYIVNREKLK